MPYLLLVLPVAGLLAAALCWRAVCWRTACNARFQRLEIAARESLASEQRLRALIVELQGEVEELRNLEREAVPHAPLSMTLAKRSQALRLLRRGEPPENVAASLGIARNQVRMLVKVQDLMNNLQRN